MMITYSKTTLKLFPIIERGEGLKHDPQGFMPIWISSRPHCL